MRIDNKRSYLLYGDFQTGDTLATVTGWALLTLWTRAQVGPCQVAVYHSELRYRRPVEAGFEAVAQLPDALALETLRQRLRQHGKGRVDVAVTVRSAGQDALQFFAELQQQALYVRVRLLQFR